MPHEGAVELDREPRSGTDKRCWYTAFALILRNDHIEKCAGRECHVSLTSLMELAEAAGAVFSEPERSLFSHPGVKLTPESYGLGDGNPQFELSIRLDDALIGRSLIHDPFVSTTLSASWSRWEHLKGFFRPKRKRFLVRVSATEGAERVIMQLDPYRMERETADILLERKNSREQNDRDGVRGYFAEQKD